MALRSQIFEYLRKTFSRRAFWGTSHRFLHKKKKKLRKRLATCRPFLRTVVGGANLRHSWGGKFPSFNLNQLVLLYIIGPDTYTRLYVLCATYLYNTLYTLYDVRFVYAWHVFVRTECCFRCSTVFLLCCSCCSCCLLLLFVVVCRMAKIVAVVY